MSPKVPLYLSWAMLIGCVFGYPLLAFWLAKNEPPAILALSVAALMYSAVGNIISADIHVKQEDDGGD